MNQKKIGDFIAKMRKEKHMTQKELADQLGISDKTISKWECGNGMPENSLMIPLCSLLQINANELLSGERLSEEEYSGKAEENILNLIDETTKNKKKKTHAAIMFLVELMSICALITAITWISAGSDTLSAMMINYVDVPTFLALALIVLLMLAVSGLIRDFGKAFQIVFSKGRQYQLWEIEKAIAAIGLTGKALWYGGILWSFLDTIITLHVLMEPAQLGPMVAVIILSLMYSALFNIILLPLRCRLEVMKIEYREESCRI